jgi:hypothetical protein
LRLHFQKPRRCLGDLSTYQLFWPGDAAKSGTLPPLAIMMGAMLAQFPTPNRRGGVT